MQGVDGGAGLEASVSVFNVALMMCVARMVRSLEFNCSLRECAAEGFLDAVLAFDDFAVVVDLAALDADFVTCADGSVSRRSNSLSVTTVAGVHAVVDDTAAFTASADDCNEAM